MCKTALSPLLMQWRYCSHALSHQYGQDKILMEYFLKCIWDLNNHSVTWQRTFFVEFIVRRYLHLDFFHFAWPPPFFGQLINFGLMTQYGIRDLGYHVLVMICCLTAPNHYFYQYWHTIKILWYSFQGNFYWILSEDINPQVVSEIYTFEITTTVPRGQWVKIICQECDLIILHLLKLLSFLWLMDNYGMLLVFNVRN